MKRPVSDKHPTQPINDDRRSTRILGDRPHPPEEPAELEHEVYTSLEIGEEVEVEEVEATPEPATQELPPEKPTPPPVEKPLPPKHYAPTPRPITLPPKPAPSGMGLLAWLVLSLSLALALVSFTLTSVLLYRLYQVQSVAGEMLRTADQALSNVEAQEVIIVPYRFQGTIPFEGEIPFKQDILFPFKGTIPIKTTVQVDTVVGKITVPIDTSVYVDTEVPVNLDLTVPVSTEVEIDQMIEIPIRLNESPIKEILGSLRHWLDELQSLFG